MSANFHLLLLLLAALIVGITLLVNWGLGRRRLMTILYGAAPVLLVGLGCQLLMLAGNKPRLEWLIPLVGVLLIGAFCRSDRIFRVAAIIAPVASIVLVVHFLNVAHQPGTTNAPGIRARLAEQQQNIALKKACERLLSQFDPETEFPAGPISDIIKDADSETGIIEVTRTSPAWHSPLSQLYRVQTDRGIIWYPGGTVEDASERLEVRVP